MVIYPNPYKWFWSGYGLVYQKNRPCTPLMTFDGTLIELNFG
jgi:hypothetical protein